MPSLSSSTRRTWISSPISGSRSCGPWMSWLISWTTTLPIVRMTLRQSGWRGMCTLSTMIRPRTCSFRAQCSSVWRSSMLCLRRTSLCVGWWIGRWRIWIGQTCLPRVPMWSMLWSILILKHWMGLRPLRILKCWNVHTKVRIDLRNGIWVMKNGLFIKVSLNLMKSIILIRLFKILMRIMGT